jgi:hypothetical protein
MWLVPAPPLTGISAGANSAQESTCSHEKLSSLYVIHSRRWNMLFTDAACSTIMLMQRRIHLRAIDTELKQRGHEVLGSIYKVRTTHNVQCCLCCTSHLFPTAPLPVPSAEFF